MLPLESIQKEKLRGEVEFRGIYFAYEHSHEEEQVLRDLSFHVEPKQTVAIAGPSGAGKTSIVRLIPRLMRLILVNY